MKILLCVLMIGKKAFTNAVQPFKEIYDTGLVDMRNHTHLGDDLEPQPRPGRRLTQH